MRLLFIAIIALHGLVHSIGFFRAFGLMEGKNYNIPVSKPMGILWIITALLFEIVAVLVFNHNKQWWVIGSIAIILSQFLIIRYWSDTKFGTIINIIISAVIVVDFASWSFNVN